MKKDFDMDKREIDNIIESIENSPAADIRSRLEIHPGGYEKQINMTRSLLSGKVEIINNKSSIKIRKSLSVFSKISAIKFIRKNPIFSVGTSAFASFALTSIFILPGLIVSSLSSIDKNTYDTKLENISENIEDKIFILSKNFDNHSNRILDAFKGSDSSLNLNLSKMNEILLKKSQESNDIKLSINNLIESYEKSNYHWNIPSNIATSNNYALALSAGGPRRSTGWQVDAGLPGSIGFRLLERTQAELKPRNGTDSSSSNNIWAALNEENNPCYQASNND